MRSPARQFHSLLLAGTLTGLGGHAFAAPYFYVDWDTVNVAGGTASGVITLPDTSTVLVSFAATYANGSPGNLYFAQTNGGAN